MAIGKWIKMSNKLCIPKLSTEMDQSGLGLKGKVTVCRFNMVQPSSSDSAAQILALLMTSFLSASLLGTHLWPRVFNKARTTG
jgi:hypothetical protein